MVGPLVGSWFLFADGSAEADIATPYAVIGLVVLIVAFIFSRARLPEDDELEANAEVQTNDMHHRSLWQQRGFVWGMVALFLYVAAQTGINSSFINYVTESTTVSNAVAAQMLSFGGMGLFMLGRMFGSRVMAARAQSGGAALVCRGSHPVDGRAAHRCRMGRSCSLPGVLFVRKHYVPHHFCFGPAPCERPNQTGLIAADYVHCGRSIGTRADGLHCRPHHHGAGLSRTPCLLCVYSSLRLRLDSRKIKV